MKITYNISRPALEERGEAIREEILRAIPGAQVQADAVASRLGVELPPHADPVAANETLRLVFLSLGVQATRASEQQSGYYGAPIMPNAVFPGSPMPPPGFVGEKKRGTVRTSVFILSLIATVLVVSILAFSVGLLHGSIVGSGQTLGTGEQARSFGGGA